MEELKNCHNCVNYSEERIVDAGFTRRHIMCLEDCNIIKHEVEKNTTCGKHKGSKKNEFLKTDNVINELFGKVENPVLVINGIEFYKNGNIKVSVNKEECEKNMEGEKVEEVIKVRCKRNGFDFEKDKTYKAERTITGAYKLMNDKGVHHIFYGTDFSNYFEKVTDDVLMVECIDNNEFEGDLSKGEKYKVIYDSGVNLKVKNDRGYVQWYRKNRFRPVEPPKEENKKYYIVDEKGKEVRVDKGEIIEEYSIMELFEEKEGVVFNHADAYFKVEDGRLIRWFEGEEKAETVPMLRIYLFMKFTKVEEPKPVTTSEAMKALEEGKVVESCRGYQYKKEDDKICLYNKRRCASRSIDFEELEGLWIIL